MTPEVASLFSAELHWEPNPTRYLWLRSKYQDRWINLKINPTFPDGPAYFLVVSNDNIIEIDDLPKGWTRGPLKWPDDAKRDEPA